MLKRKGRHGPALLRLKTVVSICLLVFGFGLTQAASAQQVMYPVDVKVSPAGVIYIADIRLPGVWVVKDGKPTVFHQAERRIGAPLNRIRCLGFDADGKLLAGDSAARDVFRFGDDGKPVALTGGKISVPMGIAVDKAGDILVSDLTLQAIFKIPKAGGKPTRFASLPAPTAIAHAADGSLLVLSRSKKAQLFRVVDGKASPVVNQRPFGFPLGLAVVEKTIYVSDGYGKAIWKIDEGKAPAKWAEGNGMTLPSGLAWSKTALLVVDARARGLFSIGSDGKVTKEIDFGPLPSKKPMTTKDATKKDAAKKDATNKDAAKKSDDTKK